MNLRLSPFSRTAPSTPQPQPGLEPGLVSSGPAASRSQQPLQTTSLSRPRIYSGRIRIINFIIIKNNFMFFLFDIPMGY